MDVFESESVSMTVEPAAFIPVDGIVTIDTFNTLTYGNGYDGNTDDDGVVTLTFESDGRKLELNVDGYDIDSSAEVAVFINKEFVGFLTPTDNNSEGITTLAIDGALIDPGTNTLSFKVNGNPSQTWGITNIFLESPGMKQLPFYYDPEFTEDGWVAWQTDHDGFYIGRMDMDTGAFLGIVNHFDVAPISWFETVQAVEWIQTPDGVAAIGMSEQGLIYLSATEARILEGTEGMTFTCMPKGEVPTLRFICADADGIQYLYDDGVLTALPLRDGVAWQWLNEFEVLTRNSLTNVTSILNVETGELTTVTDVEYMQGQAAAITTSTGQQMITLRGDGYRDIYINTDDGWTFLQRMVSNMWAGDQQYSPEFFEWQGKVWIIGYLSREDTLDWTTKTAVYIYDIETDRYTQLTTVGEWKDPEVLVLNDGSLAWYADLTSKTQQLYDTVTYDYATNLGIVTEIFQRLQGFDASADHVSLGGEGAFLVPAGAGQAEALQAPQLHLAASRLQLSDALSLFDTEDSFVFRPQHVKPAQDLLDLAGLTGIGPRANGLTISSALGGGT